MQKIFSLTATDKAAPRVVEAVKNDVRKYVKRERRKTLPEGFSQWHFNCKAGPDRATAVACPVADLGAAIDAVVSAGSEVVYIEVMAQAGHRTVGDAPPATGVPPVPDAGAV